MTRPVRPFWRIVSVFDPEGHRLDFAYTQGLASRAGCELHLCARPTLGRDAGADWKLSPRDCACLLNRFSWQLLAGTLVPSWELEGFDRGQTRGQVRGRGVWRLTRDPLLGQALSAGIVLLVWVWTVVRRARDRTSRPR